MNLIEPNKGCAIFNYGWETKAFYRKWSNRSVFADGMAGAVIEQFGENGPHSEALFDLFKNVILTDAEYVERLKRHYKLFRSRVEEKASAGKRHWRFRSV